MFDFSSFFSLKYPHVIPPRLAKNMNRGNIIIQQAQPSRENTRVIIKNPKIGIHGVMMRYPKLFMLSSFEKWIVITPTRYGSPAKNDTVITDQMSFQELPNKKRKQRAMEIGSPSINKSFESF